MPCSGCPGMHGVNPSSKKKKKTHYHVKGSLHIHFKHLHDYNHHQHYHVTNIIEKTLGADMTGRAIFYLLIPSHVSVIHPILTSE